MFPHALPLDVGHTPVIGQGLPLSYAVLIISLNADTSLFRKADTFFGPTSVVTVQNLLDNADVCLIDNKVSATLRIAADSR